MSTASNRAVLFIDGNNFYRGMKRAGLARVRSLDFAKVARKLVGRRHWIGTRYYVGRADPTRSQHAGFQQSFLAKFVADDPARHSVHFGRIESRPVDHAGTDEVLAYLANLRTPIDAVVRAELTRICERHRSATALVEKAVDVMLAVDLVVMALRDEYDTAYVLSADGDFTHAVHVARSCGKRVFAASGSHGAQLAAAVHAFLPLKTAWFADCYR